MRDVEADIAEALSNEADGAPSPASTRRLTPRADRSCTVLTKWARLRPRPVALPASSPRRGPGSRSRRSPSCPDARHARRRRSHHRSPSSRRRTEPGRRTQPPGRLDPGGLNPLPRLPWPWRRRVGAPEPLPDLEDGWWRITGCPRELGNREQSDTRAHGIAAIAEPALRPGAPRPPACRRRAARSSLWPARWFAGGDGGRLGRHADDGSLVRVLTAAVVVAPSSSVMARSSPRPQRLSQAFAVSETVTPGTTVFLSTVTPVGRSAREVAGLVLDLREALTAAYAASGRTAPGRTPAQLSVPSRRETGAGRRRRRATRAVPAAASLSHL